MARMIPPVIGGEVKSPGERDLFKIFKSDQNSKGWVVLHSFDVAKHKSQVEGEIDLLVIIPHLGVVCLEVKACQSLEIREGRWKYGRNPKWDHRGPFKQASEAMHSLRNQVVKAQPSLSKIVFISAVAFTHMSFDLTSHEWHQWQALDKGFLQSRGVVEALSGVLHAARRRLVETPSAKWFKSSNNRPDGEDIKRLVSTLRPNFESYESPQSRVSRGVAEAKKYTEEQYRALDFAEGNDRVVFEGPAGSGKTLIAIECARRAAVSGRKTLFLCFNELLGDWLEKQLMPLASNVDFDRIARRMLRVSGLRAREDPGFWSNELPFAAVSALKDDPDGSLQSYDELIVDEAQDFLRNGFIDFLDHSVIGGLQGGRIRLFGDYERQAVFQSAEISLPEFREGWIPDLASVRLRSNCRNTPRVAALASILGGLDPDYSLVLREDDEIDPVIIEYRDQDEQSSILIDTLLDLLNEGFEAANIAVLSMKPSDMCINRITHGASRSKFSGGERPSKGAVFSSSVRRFKGLEAPVVIVTDIEDIVSEEAEMLLYVSVTRAVSKIVLLIQSDARKDYVRQAQGRVE